jgi:hypothetical protein
MPNRWDRAKRWVKASIDELRRDPRAPLHELRRDPLRPLAAFIAGALVGATLVFCDALAGYVVIDENAWKRAGDFLDNPETVVWLTLLCAQAGIWAIVFAASRGALREVAAGASLPVAIAGFGLIFVLVALTVIVPALTSGAPTPLPDHRWKLSSFIVLAFVAAGPWILAIWRIGTIARRLEAKARDRAPGWKNELATEGAHPFDGYLGLRERLGHAVTILSVIVVGITLSTGALRLAVKAYDSNAVFPPASVLVYGGFFSLLLALIYLPVQLRVLELGRHLRDDAAPVAPSDHWRGDAFKRRGEAEALLNLTAGPVASLQTGLAILAPLATALVAALLSTS